MNTQPKANGEKFSGTISLANRKTLEAEIRESFGRVLYSFKAQEKCADIIAEKMQKIKIWQIVLSAISAGGFLGAGFDALKVLPLPETWIAMGNSILMIVSGIVSLILLCINSYTKENDLCAQTQLHKEAANKLLVIRDKYIFLISDIKMGKPLKIIEEKRLTLSEELHSVYSTSPNTNSKAYAEAQKALKEAEDFTFSKEEIDKFLPAELRFDAPICQQVEQPRHILADE